MDGGMLSQDEINALLNGMDLSVDEALDITDEQYAPADESPKPVQEGAESGAAPGMDDVVLTDVEKDAIGEVANISMGSSATTLYSLVNKKVNITTPVVALAVWDTLLEEYEKPCVFIQIKYTQGLDGTNILILKEHDVKVITDLMMGGDGTNTDGELGELHLSAISEAMNQMMGSAATSLSTMLQTMIDISPPDSTLLDLAQYKSGAEISPFLGGTFVKIAFRMQIDDLVDSSIMQLYPIEFARRLVDTFINTQMGGSADTPAAPSEPEPVNNNSNNMEAAPAAGANQMGMNPMDMNQTGMNQAGMNPMMNQMGMNPMDMSQMGMNPMMGQMVMNPMMGMNPMMNQMAMNPMGYAPQMNAQNVNVQPAQFQNFSQNAANMAGQENIGLIMDVPLEVTVELGRTKKSISEILNFAPGTIIELDRIAGEPIDVLVNGKFVAKGEVVVIEESFGVRVTDIIK